MRHLAQTANHIKLCLANVPDCEAPRGTELSCKFEQTCSRDEHEHELELESVHDLELGSRESKIWCSAKKKLLLQRPIDHKMPCSSATAATLCAGVRRCPVVSLRNTQKLRGICMVRSYLGTQIVKMAGKLEGHAFC